MSTLRNTINLFAQSEDAAALVEYALLLALIAVISIILVTAVGAKVSMKFSEIEADL
jgi:pilus assembly protein Flp/PilA